MMVDKNVIKTANISSAISQSALSSTSISFIIVLFISISKPVLVNASASNLSTAFWRLVKSLESRYSVHSDCVRQCVLGLMLLRFASSYLCGGMLMIVKFLVYSRGKRRRGDWFWRRYWLLGAFARTLKAPISFVMSVCTSAYRHVSTRPPLAEYSWNLLLLNLSKISKFYYNRTKMSSRFHPSLLPNHAQDCSCLGTSLLTVSFNCL
jgi:hypothetical protein